MPKIMNRRAALTGILAATGAGYVAVSDVVAQTKPAGTPDNSGWYNVKAFGAVGNGSTDDTAAIQAVIDAIGRSTRAITRGTVLLPPGTYLISRQLEIDQQSIEFLGVGSPILQWGGNNTSAMFHVKDSSRCLWDGLIFLGKNASQPTAAIYLDEPVSSTLGTNEYSIIRNCQFGRRWTQESSNTKLQRGVWIGGASNTNNDSFYIEQCQFHDCVTAGVAIDNNQSIWGSLRDVTFNACGYGLYTGSNTICYNLSFNRCATNDLYAFRDITVSIFGFNSEHSREPIKGAQGASISIDGGKILVNRECVGPNWCQTNGWLSLKNLQVIESGVSGKVLNATGSSAGAVSIYVRTSRLPGGDDGRGFSLSGVGKGQFVDIKHGPFVAHEHKKK